MRQLGVGIIRTPTRMGVCAARRPSRPLASGTFCQKLDSIMPRTMVAVILRSIHIQN